MRAHRLWILPMLLLLFGACQKNSEEADAIKAKISKPLQTSIRNGTPVPKPTITVTKPATQQSTAATLGITVDDGKIIIDTRQTKDFLRGIGGKMKHSFQKIEESLRREKISSPDETGIIISDTTLQVDLNKTRHFMEKWMRSMESVVNELNKTMGEIKRSLPRR